MVETPVKAYVIREQVYGLHDATNWVERYVKDRQYMNIRWHLSMLTQPLWYVFENKEGVTVRVYGIELTLL